MDRVLNAFQRRLEIDHEMAYYNAWWSGFFSQAWKEFPAYDRYAPSQNSKPVKEQSWQAQQAMAKTLTVLFGGEVN